MNDKTKRWRVPAGTSLYMNRREMLQKSALAGVAGTALLSGLKPASAAPKRGGTLRAAKGHGSTSDTLDPAIWDNGYVIAQAYGMHGFLTGVAADGSLQPEIAESWEPSEDAVIWRAKLRGGTSFHSGKSITPEDVIASVNYHRGEDSKSAAKPLLSGITDIKIDGDTVVFELSAGNADFPVTFTDYHLPILPSSDGEIDFRSGDGCGTYKLVNFEPGVSSKFERFENDWNNERGWFEAIEMLSIVDVNARTTAMVSGDVDAIDKLDLKTIALLARNPNLDVHSVAGGQHYTFAMSTNKDPFTDVNVRRALKHAINREELVEKILFGYGTVGNDHPIAPGMKYHNAELPQTPFDPDKAKFFLKEAGLDGLSVELAAADAAFPGAVDAAQLFQNSAKDAGIDLTVNRVANDGYWSDVWMTHPFSAVYWGGRPVEDSMLTLAYASGASWNDTFWENGRFNELLVAARAELDEAKRREMYYEMQAILSDDGGTVLPMFANYVFASTKKVATTGEFGSNWDMDGERWMERWWFA
ncbi:MAG: ABC transporter substrate-binding protein [Pseudomonadota bacterium]